MGNYRYIEYILILESKCRKLNLIHVVAALGPEGRWKLKASLQDGY